MSGGAEEQIREDKPDEEAIDIMGVTETLSDKRKELVKLYMGFKISSLDLFEKIEEQDKQFIKDLKEHFGDADNGVIDKLAGDKLI